MNKNFDIFYNALSVGWHLRKIHEIDPDFMADPHQWDLFERWMERHEIKKYEK